ncbi:hypothetical protein HS088_TW06G01461 [Tripterygium wilfordii]|uniref:SMP-LTD domain-containing protein n=1 Tax=Tripterygium wilfordii TaxID=458696 RepID=A0A7J7DLN4_TRIWF|nr:testis-expressed protein 2-like [Tripterygium wilfordii]KAF5747280.1 hypothetical protein HS088_TW06G01461 [Tripterygium wilfordii]
MLVLWVSVFLSGFLVGALTLAAFEGLGLMLVLKRLNRKNTKLEAQNLSSSDQQGPDPRQSLESSYTKEGVVWVLESDKVPKIWLLEKVPREQKRKREYFEVSPARKYAKIKNCSLILKESDGSQTAISLKGCVIEAVSATNLSSRKWAKRFPIRVENKTEAIHNGSKIFYVYLETSWEKESWCKSLRLASGDNKERIIWFTKWHNEFNSYLASLKAGNLPFGRLMMGLNGEPLDHETRLDGSSSKVRLFLKRLARRASKSGVENKGTLISSYGRIERKTSENFRPVQDSILATTLTKSAPTVKTPKISSARESTEFSASTFPHSGSQSNLSSISDAEADDKLNFDEGTFCLNLLISRLFFDAKSSSEVKSSMKARIQRTLSNMRTPSYIGEVVCSDIDLGNLPPYIGGMRVCPTDMNEVWALEVDIEYSGGAIFDVETRVEVRELDLQKGVADSNSESSSINVSPDLLEGFEQLGKQLNLSEGTIDAEEHKNAADTSFDGGVSSSTCGSRWKSILNSVAKQVSQVPLSLSIQVASLRGTMRIYVKSPPSDQLWFGFTSMPNIELDLASSVGEHKITSGQVASFLINKFKAAIQETMVLPNCENLSIPWMLAETDDWVPRKVAPFMWLNQEAVSDHTAHEAFSSLQPVESETNNETSRGTSTDHTESKHKKEKNVDCLQQPTIDSSNALGSSLSSTERGSKSLQLKTPLLADDTTEETCKEDIGETPESHSPTTSLTSSEKQDYVLEDDDLRPKKIGRKARMFDFGKKMGEKLGEKRRHLEEE